MRASLRGSTCMWSAQGMLRQPRWRARLRPQALDPASTTTLMVTSTDGVRGRVVTSTPEGAEVEDPETLPFTGSHDGYWFVLAVAALVVGAILVVGTRETRASTESSEGPGATARGLPKGPSSPLFPEAAVAGSSSVRGGHIRFLHGLLSSLHQGRRSRPPLPADHRCRGREPSLPPVRRYRQHPPVGK